MGRSSRSRALAVWMNGERVATWTVKADGTDQLHYADEWLNSRFARPLSLSMPLRPSPEPYRGALVRNFFDNLLPDTEELRGRIQSRFGAPSTSAFDLLAEVGRDCVGAIQLLPPDAPAPDPTRIQGEPLESEDVERILEAVPGGPPLGHRGGGDFRISLAGAQEKTALLWRDGRWMRPLGATPTTHIFKLPLGHVAGLDLSTSVENEWLCHVLLQAFGIPVAPCHRGTFGEQRALIVERFDRRTMAEGGWIARLPQEDLCQATRTPRALKYEADGGPGIKRILDLLLGSESAILDREDFFRTQVAFWLLCAIDGHAKNFSVFLLPGGRFRLTPRYDVLSAHPVLGRGRGRLSEHEVKMAMAAWGKTRHYSWNRIHRRHWLQVGADCGIPRAEEILEELAEATPGVLGQVARQLPQDFPQEVASPILDGLAAAAQRLKS